MNTGDTHRPDSRLNDTPRLPFPKPPSSSELTTAAKLSAPTGTAPFSIRLTAEERAYLESAAGRQPLGTYIRNRLLDGLAAHRRSHRKPVRDDEAAGRLLAQLGQSRLASNLNKLAKAAHIGALPVTPEIGNELRAACADIRAMRLDLIRALGLQEMAPP